MSGILNISEKRITDSKWIVDPALDRWLDSEFTKQPTEVPFHLQTTEKIAPLALSALKTPRVEKRKREQPVPATVVEQKPAKAPRLEESQTTPRSPVAIASESLLALSCNETMEIENIVPAPTENNQLSPKKAPIIKLNSTQMDKARLNKLVTSKLFFASAANIYIDLSIRDYVLSSEKKELRKEYQERALLYTQQSQKASRIQPRITRKIESSLSQDFPIEKEK